MTFLIGGLLIGGALGAAIQYALGPIAPTDLREVR